MRSMGGGGLHRDGWMDERCFRPLFCTIKAELGRGQPGLAYTGIILIPKVIIKVDQV